MSWAPSGSTMGSRSRRTKTREPHVASGRRGAVTNQQTRRTALARFDALFTDHQRPILAYAMRRTPTLADAEDVAAETFSIAWRKIEAVPADALPWLYAVARRVLANHRRGRSRLERLTALLRVDDVPTPMLAGADHDGPACAALASLPPADQELLRLVAWEDLGNQEIAVALGVTPNAVAIRLHRARARFANALARTSVEDDLKDLDPSRTSADVKGIHRAAWKGVGE